MLSQAANQPCIQANLHTTVTLGSQGDITRVATDMMTAQVASPSSNTVISRPNSVAFTSLVQDTMAHLKAEDEANIPPSIQMSNEKLIDSFATSLNVLTAQMTIIRQEVVQTPELAADGSGDDNKLSGGSVAGIHAVMYKYKWKAVMYKYKWKAAVRSNEYKAPDSRMVMWHNQLANMRQTTGHSPHQHYITANAFATKSDALASHHTSVSGLAQ
eukprot:gene3701-13770_t